MLNVLYRDDDLIAVFKPAGLMVHKSSMSSDRTFLLQQLRTQIKRRLYPVHRLDRPTSGIVLFALHKESAAKMAEQFQHQQIQKSYLAVVRGFTESEGVIDYPLKNEETGTVQEAITEYQRISTVELDIPVRPFDTSRYSLVRVFPKSGRRHQIRRHFAHLRHPIVGDVNHGDGHHNRMFRNEFDCHRLLLSANRLTFAHPYRDETIDIRAPIESELSDLFIRLFGNDIVDKLDISD